MSDTPALILLNIVFDYLKNVENSYITKFLVNWPSKPFKTRKVSQCLLPVLSYLPEINVNENDKAVPVIKTLKVYANDLCWGQTYTAADFGEAFLEKYGWTELIGVRGPVKSRDIACGFLLLGPNIEYPKHSHEAEEVYVPINSEAWWIQENDDWVSRQRGVPIYHRPWLSHGIRTGSSPLLALYIWQGGNLTQKSHIE